MKFENRQNESVMLAVRTAVISGRQGKVPAAKGTRVPSEILDVSTLKVAWLRTYVRGHRAYTKDFVHFLVCILHLNKNAKKKKAEKRGKSYLQRDYS